MSPSSFGDFFAVILFVVGNPADSYSYQYYGFKAIAYATRTSSAVALSADCFLAR